jgi:hypothetical protein
LSIHPPCGMEIYLLRRLQIAFISDENKLEALPLKYRLIRSR